MTLMIAILRVMLMITPPFPPPPLTQVAAIKTQ